MEPNKEVFVTYAWDDEEHKDFVFEFVDFLREKGFDAEMDTLKSQQETATDFTKMMHQAMTDYKKVIIVLSKKYKERAESFEGGVGTEYGLIIKDIHTDLKKYILVSRHGHGHDVTPMAFRDREIIDISRYKLDNMNTLFGKIMDQSTIEFKPVGVSRPEITVLRSGTLPKEEILINDISLITSGSNMFEGQYRSIEFEVKASIKNVSTKPLLDATLEIEMPAKLCNGFGISSKNYQDDDNYRQENGRSLFTFDIKKLFVNQVFSSKSINIDITNNIIDEIFQQTIIVRVYSDTASPEREFTIGDFLFDHSKKRLTVNSFRTKFNQYRVG